MADDVVILNVDDNEAPRYTKTRQLRQAGFEVAEAVNGYEALTRVQSLQPAVVVLDVQLPDISGIDVCRRIKSEWPRTMVLQTSATYTTGADRTRGLDNGADGYLTQPIEPGELVAAVRALLRIRKAEDALHVLNATLEERVRERTRELASTNAELQREIEQRQKAEAALVQSQKMEAIGQLTGGIAHDFNNLLTAVVGNIDLIRRRAKDPNLLRLAENAYKAAERGSKLTSQLLAFSRSQQLTVSAVDVKSIILGMSDLLSQTLGPSIKIVADLPDDTPPALADANQLELAILNLAINSRDAMPQGGTLQVALARTELGEAETTLAAGTYVDVTLSDTGSGMSVETASRAFDPFFTTKPPGKGTGLGLSQVYGIVRQTGGDVSLESKPDEGTTVRLRFPAAAHAIGAATEEISQDMVMGHSEHILVVDDDPDVRAVIVDLLQTHGYRATDTGEPQRGLQLANESTPDLILLDFAMPDITGADFVTNIRTTQPDVRILFLSGFADMTALKAAARDVPILRKPFRPMELMRAIRNELQQRPHRPDVIPTP